MKKTTLVFLFLLSALPLTILAANNDSIPPPKQPYHKNVIKFNPTPMLLWSWKNITFSYERILSPRQSISIELGYLEMPRLYEDTIARLVNITSHSKHGINATIEYRFYISQLNTRPIPAGLYIGPYLTYYGYSFKNDFDILHTSIDSTGTIKGNYWAFNLGIELGYQFVFWKRLTLDMVLLGPSLAYYGGKTDISGNLSGSQIQDMNEAIYEKLKERFPMIHSLSLDKSFQQTGKLDVVRWGLRYLVQIGFHF
ncbi:MAG: DUF3575 domain-containing protein [Bacteroidetes bacterium]|nr:DUF3575 domain-containing protein [Bacteroidota bacterium]